jgi:hypothetical protein
MSLIINWRRCAGRASGLIYGSTPALARRGGRKPQKGSQCVGVGSNQSEENLLGTLEFHIKL